MQQDHDLLMRIDERTLKICQRLDKCVTSAEFWPIKTLVYSAAGIMLAGVMTAIVALVIKGGHF